MYKERIMKRKIAFVVLTAVFVAAALLFFGCETDVLVSVNFDYDEFISQQALWDESKPANYEFHYEAWSDGLFTPVKTLIVVEGRKFVSQTADEVGHSEADKGFTIDDFYESVVSGYLKWNGTTVKSNENYLTDIEVEWDKEKHIPLKVTMLYYVPEILVDAASRFERTISDFKATE